MWRRPSGTFVWSDLLFIHYCFLELFLEECLVFIVGHRDPNMILSNISHISDSAFCPQDCLQLSRRESIGLGRGAAPTTGAQLKCTCVMAERAPPMPDYSCPVSGTIVSCTVVLQPGAHVFGTSRCLPSAAVFLFRTHDMCDCLVIHDMCDCLVFGVLRHDKKQL